MIEVSATIWVDSFFEQEEPFLYYKRSIPLGAFTKWPETDARRGNEDNGDVNNSSYFNVS